MTIALAAFAFAANAQFVIGGNVGIAHGGTSNGDFNDEASTNMSIKPKVGYWLNDKMQVGMQFGLDYAYTRDYSGTDNAKYESATSTSWQFAPYFRYNVANWKNFTIFCEAQLGLGITPKSSWMRNYPTETSGEGSTSSFDLGLVVLPGLNYALTDHISLDLYVNLLGLYYNYASYTTTNFDGTESTSHSHNWGLIANMNAQSIDSHLNNFAIGFNYAF